MVKLFDFKHLKIYTKKFRETYKLHAGKQLDIAVFFCATGCTIRTKVLKVCVNTLGASHDLRFWSYQNGV
jgi:hypothetical protein